MTSRSSKQNNDNERGKLFGLWIENRMVQVAIATPIDGERYRLEIDAIGCPIANGWLTASHASAFAAAIATLVDRHDMRRGTVCLSLDGDICVNRITLGTPETVDHELSTLQHRVPRYLQLGPGEKVTGLLRTRIDGQSDYAATSVANQSVMRMIYDTLRESDIEVAWAEPSLISMARLIGYTSTDSAHPLLIADGTGTRWNVGIIHEGRLILDYRPATAKTVEALQATLDGHISRLQRFCHRHLGIDGGGLKKLLICGTAEKVEDAAARFQRSPEFDEVILRVPPSPQLYDISNVDCDSHCVPAVASVLPLMLGVTAEEVPDLLRDVRRAPELSLPAQLLRVAWPAFLAALLLMLSFTLVHRARQHASHLKHGTEQVQVQVIATQTRMTELARQRELLEHFKTIERQSAEVDWIAQLERITQSLPDLAKLNEYRVESGSHIRLEGTVLDERVVYEILEQLRQLPEVSEVALHSTTPEANSEATRFSIRLSMTPRHPLSVEPSQHE
ncbi:PilN domain-containing protein [Novipirellula sp.]|uniref:PilN domain-containing protein n=1 Tax=Novipirellula sp. TaxID=2795430 RepID=UPI003566EB03